MATTEKMSIHRCLAELKILDDRIKDAIEDGVFCQVNIEKNEKIEGLIVKDYIDTVINASYDKANDLIRRRDAIRMAVNNSNAITKVTVAGNEYTVATAIWLKQYGMDLKKKLLNQMKSQYSICRKKADVHNESRLAKAEKYVLEMYGSKESKPDLKAIEEDKKKHMDANTMNILDPINIQEKINVLESEISNFLAEIDAALSVSNALTEVEITY